jgi:peptide/nickel transport system ATP-binding protein
VFDGLELGRGGAFTTTGPRRRIQIVFQNPFESLNPSSSRAHRRSSGRCGYCAACRGPRPRKRLAELLERVELPKRWQPLPGRARGRRATTGGDRSGSGCEPDQLICDEVTSALDVSVQAAVLELLQELQRELRLSMLFITHNLAWSRPLPIRSW